MSNNGLFATSILTVLAKERGEAHRDQINGSKSQQTIRLDNPVTVRATAHSKAEKLIVEKNLLPS